MLVDLELIRKAEMKLGERNADIIADLLHVENWDPKNKKGCCPFHDERTPSFVYNPKLCKCKCFGCNKNVDIIDAYMSSGKTYIEAVKTLFEEAKVKYSFGEVGVKTEPTYKYPHEEPLNAKENVYKYFAMRGISPETVDAVDVREDAHGNCVFNFYDTNDVLTMVKYRPSHKIDKSKGEIKSWCQRDADTKPLLFNMNRVNVDKPLVITEGEADTMAVIEAGWSNAVSVPLGSQNLHWIEENFEWLEQFNSIIICSDNDEPGVKMRKECVARLGSWRTKYVEIPEFIVTVEDGVVHATKDANEVLYYAGKEELYRLITEAKDPGIPSVCDITDIEDQDIDSMDGIETGIAPLDKEIMKLFKGTLTVVSGTPGSGKTSFLSQLVCNAMDSGENVAMFSKEMPGFLQKNWIVSVMAGPANCKEYEDANGCKYYKVPQDVKTKINEYYAKKCYLYRDDYSNKFEDVLQTMTDCRQKYGCSLCILDNLMCLDLNSDADSELQKQTYCINRLIDFAMKYQVVVILVAHPRKLATGMDVGIYDVAGSSNIANLAHRTISLRRIDSVKERNPYSVSLTIIKDRLRGKAGKKIDIYYDTPSRRFYTSEAEYNRQYLWEGDVRRPWLPYPHADEGEVLGTINLSR